VINEAKQIMGIPAHPHILTLVNFLASSTIKNPKKKDIPVECVIILNHVSGGELFDHISKTGPLTDDFCRYYLK